MEAKRIFYNGVILLTTEVTTSRRGRWRT